MSLKRTPEQVAISIAVRIALLALFAYLTLSVIAPFLGIFAWSVIVVVALYPVYAWLSARLGGLAWLAALIVSLVCLMIVFGPVAILTSSVAVSLEHVAEGIRTGTFALPAPPDALSHVPVVGKGISETWTLATTNSAAFFGKYGHTLVKPGEWLLKLVASLAGSILAFAIASVIAGLLFVPGPRLIGRIRGVVLDIAGERGTRFVDLARATIRSVARGVIGVSFLQMLAVGTALVVAGVPHAGLFTIAVLFCSLAQLGAGPVVGPLVIWFWLTRDPAPALFFTVYMAIAVALEHILKPIAMGQGLETPLAVILIGILGGTLAYGLPGLFLGPMILALAYELLNFWAEDRAALRREADPDIPG